jgi:anti-anti-sigma factor
VGLYDLPSLIIEQDWQRSASSLQNRPNPGVLVRLGGEFDASYSEELLSKLRALLADGGVELTLDLRDVGFFSASTIDVIVQLQQLLQRDGLSLNVVHPSTHVQKVFVAAGLSSLINDVSGAKAPLVEGQLRVRDFAYPGRGKGEALASWVAVPPTGTAGSPEFPAQKESPLFSESPEFEGYNAEVTAMDNDDFELGMVRCGWA